MQSPSERYRRLAEHRRSDALALERGDRRFSNARVLMFVLGLVALGVALGTNQPLWMLLVAAFGLTFVGLVVAHEQLARRQAVVMQRVAYYERGLRRLDDDWQTEGCTDRSFVPADHPYADDLDLFGQGSLFQRLCEARTKGGRERLATWLCEPADFDVVRARQGALTDLRDRCELREDLHVAGPGLEEIDVDGVVRWGQAPPLAVVRTWWLRVAMWLLPAQMIGSFIAWIAGAAPFWVMLIGAVAQGIVLRQLGGAMHQTRQELERRVPAIDALAQLLVCLERQRFSDATLSALQQQLVVDGSPPSREIQRLRWRVSCFEAYYSGWFAMFAFPLSWPAHCLVALEAWRARTGPALARFVDALSQFEALSSLAAYTFENPDDPFPELEPEGPCLIGKELGHPLLKRSECVRNSVYLDATRQALLISGSNMSGKSTFLRSVGINAVIAQAGGPVRAKTLRISALRIGATVRIEDSLQAGRSRFYAEIVRLKAIVDLAQASDGRHLLFLLDEVFHGTNSRDRRISAAALLRLLVEKSALGLVTTHDLELTKVADELAPRLRNVHFCDELRGDKLHFDYSLRPGVVQRSNARALMRAVGLALPSGDAIG